MNIDIIQCIILIIGNITDLKSLRRTSKIFNHCLNDKYVLKLLSQKFNTDNAFSFIDFINRIGYCCVPTNKNYKEMRTTQCPYNRINELTSYSCYYTYELGETFYKIIVHDDLISIYKYGIMEDGDFYSWSIDEDGERPELYQTLVTTYQPQHLFFGRNVETDRITAMLLHKKNLTYIFIGSLIYKFTAKAKIIHFVSPLDHDIAYHYAVDEYNNIYLMSDQKMIKMNGDIFQDLKLFQCPYYYCYVNGEMIKNINMDITFIHQAN
jgi:hypothetical protein